MEHQIENLTPERNIFFAQTTENIGKSILLHLIVSLPLVACRSNRMIAVFFM